VIFTIGGARKGPFNGRELQKLIKERERERESAKKIAASVSTADNNTSSLYFYYRGMYVGLLFANRRSEDWQ
jgi:hypothetical protein